jgi:hypothetical protein
MLQLDGSPSYVLDAAMSALELNEQNSSFLSEHDVTNLGSNAIEALCSRNKAERAAALQHQEEVVAVRRQAEADRAVEG